MRYIVFEYIGMETLYIVPADDEEEMDAIMQMQNEYPEKIQKIGEFFSEFPLPYNWRYFACVQHGKDTCPAYWLVKKANRNADYMY